MEKKASFTGHRPQKLPWGFHEQSPLCMAFKVQLQDAVQNAIQNGYYYFLSGMALGCDIYFSEIVLSYKEQNPAIKLECVIPFEKQAASWDLHQKKRYFEIIDKSDMKTLISDHYYPGCYIVRNRYMVDHSALLIAALADGQVGGSKSTLAYARKLNKDIRIVPV